ncbi:hypothetical protein IKE19_00780 [Candidatus Saccharibacteria bacterium]|nr:hypothetical protein [Candidatus Saccharibacteria bacterium]
MAREISFAKRAKISQAQQYMLLSVLGASVILGASVSLIMHFFSQISFNAKVVSEEDNSIVVYSDAIKNIGICPKPNGSTYSDDELKKCNPDSVSVSSVPGSLRANILEDMAGNAALSSVPKENNDVCINPAKVGDSRYKNKYYTYNEMQELYNNADTDEKLAAATDLIQTCSALRVIPDALPAFKNEEALLASLNKIFLISDWEPESLSPSGEIQAAEFGTNLNALSVSLTIETDAAEVREILDNIERSIRDFDIKRATFEWTSDTALSLRAQATAYYMDPISISETTNTITPGGK